MEKEDFAKRFAEALNLIGSTISDEKTGKELTPVQFSQAYLEDLYRKKIKGWYSKKEYEDRAIKRMLDVRTEIISLLRSTSRDGIENVIQYLDDRGFYYRASSPNGHHNFPGGLAEHSLGVYKYAKNAAKKYSLDEDSVIIAALLHDICKADRSWFKGRAIYEHTPHCDMDGRHSVRSIALLKNCGLKLTEQERRAIRWHMKGHKYHSRDSKLEADHSKAIKECLWKVVFESDKKDAGDHPASHCKIQK